MSQDVGISSEELCDADTTVTGEKAQFEKLPDATAEAKESCVTGSASELWTPL